MLEGDLQKKLGGVNNRVDRASSDLETERHQRTAETANLHQLVTKLFIGGLDLEVAGLAWIVAGLVLSTWPEAIASWPVLRRFNAGT